ncbi:hypothetical protein U1Q18_043614 [Sarracenia purpurea var. burkii]
MVGLHVVKWAQEPDLSKEKGNKSEYKQDLGDVERKDEVGVCSVEAEAAIPLAEAVSEGFHCDESDKEDSEPDSPKKKVYKSENELDLGDVVGKDEVGECSVEAKAVI